MTAFTEESVWNIMVQQLQQLMADQDMELGEVTRSTRMIADLAIPSIDLIHLMVGLEESFQQPLNFDEFVERGDSSVRDDISLGELFDFVYEKVGAGNEARSAGQSS